MSIFNILWIFLLFIHWKFKILLLWECLKENKSEELSWPQALYNKIDFRMLKFLPLASYISNDGSSEFNCGTKTEIMIPQLPALLLHVLRKRDNRHNRLRTGNTWFQSVFLIKLQALIVTWAPIKLQNYKNHRLLKAYCRIFATFVPLKRNTQISSTRRNNARFAYKALLCSLDFQSGRFRVTGSDCNNCHRLKGAD